MTEENNTNESLKLNSKFIQNIKGKEFILYAGLLDYAHQKGLLKLEVKLIQIPNDENNQVAICFARTISKEGEVFTDVGDANPTNVTEKIAPHIIRMASTRAKARCLRDFCNVGMVCVEELDEDSIQNDYEGYKQYSNNRCNGNGNYSSYAQSNTSNGNNHSSNRSMSEAQRRAIFNLAKRRKLSEDELQQLIQEQYQTSLDDLTIQSASNLIQSLQNQN